MKRAALGAAGAGYDDCATVSGAGDGARAQDGGNRKESGYADVYRPRKLHRTGNPQRPGLAQAGGRVPQAMREGSRAS